MAKHAAATRVAECNIRKAQSFGEQSVQQFFELGRITQAANIFDRSTSAALGELRTAFDADALTNRLLKTGEWSGQ